MNKGRKPQSYREKPRPNSAGRPTADEGGDIGAVMQFGLSIVLFTLLGRWLDTRFATSPLLTVLGTAVGAGGGFYSMYRRLTQSERRLTKRKEVTRGTDGGGSEDPERLGKTD